MCSGSDSLRFDVGINLRNPSWGGKGLGEGKGVGQSPSSFDYGMVYVWLWNSLHDTVAELRQQVVVVLHQTIRGHKSRC